MFSRIFPVTLLRKLAPAYTGIIHYDPKHSKNVNKFHNIQGLIINSFKSDRNKALIYSVSQVESPRERNIFLFRGVRTQRKEEKHPNRSYFI